MTVINLPEELKVLSVPKFKTADKKLIVFNRPSLWDLIVPLIFMSAFIVMILNGKISFRDSENRDELILVIFMMLFILIKSFSLNKILIDFEQKLIHIKNYNPLVNLKFLKLPFLIPFNEIEKVYPDYEFWGRNQYKQKVILQTIAPYKFRIAIFSEENQSIIFTDYLNKIIKHHSIHTVQGSDTTVLN